ncbi:hypothetical protein HF072_17020 [Bacillus sp. RO3]|nr:hypothetical protein [Bacillus sp. RO3]
MKKIIVVLTLVLALTFAGVSSALAATSFNTEDGRYEMSLTTTSSKNDVKITVSNLVELHYAGYESSASGTQLQARLCSASTGNCTGYQTMGGNTTTFTNMIPSTYYVDIRDVMSSSSISGKVSAYAY